MNAFCVLFALVCSVEFAPLRVDHVVVDLSAQYMYAYDGAVLVDTMPVSTGGTGMETPVGHYHVYARVPVADVSSRFAYVEGVRWIMKFVGPYYIHAGDLSTPSHGCVRLSEEDAQWLYSVSGIGMSVEVVW